MVGATLYEGKLCPTPGLVSCVFNVLTRSSNDPPLLAFGFRL